MKSTKIERELDPYESVVGFEWIWIVGGVQAVYLFLYKVQSNRVKRLLNISTFILSISSPNIIHISWVYVYVYIGREREWGMECDCDEMELLK